VIRWPEEAGRCSREAVKLLSEGKVRDEVIAAIAREQDESLRLDARRVETIREYSADLQKRFVELKNDWRDHKTPLRDQHQQLLNAAYPLLQKVIPNGCP
jgi:ATP-dependent protease HslVU (ClpYQ) peptidase subunit